MKCYYCEKEVKCLSLHINKSQKCQESEHDRFNEFDVEEETIDTKNSDHYRKINEWRIIYEKSLRNYYAWLRRHRMHTTSTKNKVHYESCLADGEKSSLQLQYF